MTAPWKETTLPTIQSHYELKDVFSANEFGLFYQALSSETMHFKSQKCSSEKHSKMHLTGLAAGNAFAERFPMFVIGKSQHPKAFQRGQTFTLSISIPVEKLDLFRIIWRMGSRARPKVWRRKEKKCNGH